MQYKTGAVIAFNGSATVTGDENTDWTAITSNHWFGISGDNVLYDIVSIAKASTPSAWSAVTAYTKEQLVSKVVGTDTLYYIAIQDGTNQDPETETAYWRQTSLWQITLSTTYAAADRLDVNYAITRDFTPNNSLVLINPGDIETGALYSRAMNKIDSLLGVGPGSYFYEDDFVEVRQGQWVVVSNQGTSADTSPPSELSHPGIEKIATTSTANDDRVKYLFKTGWPFILMDQHAWEYTAVFRLPNVSNISIVVGLAIQPA
jgi:hypothetical protein